MSHATVLHHVGSRETLLQRVAERALNAMFEDLVAALGPSSAELHPQERVRTALEILDRHGHPRLLAWLALTGRAAMDRPRFGPFIELAHKTRGLNATRDGKAQPDVEDTRFLIIFTALAMLGDAVAGHLVYEDCGLEDLEQARSDFRERLIALVTSDRGEPGSTPTPTAAHAPVEREQGDEQ